jgi:MATE family multidrug resistance protein
VLLLNVLDLSPRTAWSALILFFLAFSGVFYRRFRGGKWKTLDVIREGGTVEAGGRPVCPM